MHQPCTAQRCNSKVISCRAYQVLYAQALAEQQSQLESGMSHYALEVQQVSLTVLAWQAHMAALYASPRYCHSRSRFYMLLSTLRMMCCV